MALQGPADGGDRHTQLFRDTRLRDSGPVRHLQIVAQAVGPIKLRCIGLPDLKQSKSAALNSLPFLRSRRFYDRVHWTFYHAFLFLHYWSSTIRCKPESLSFIPAMKFYTHLGV